MRASTLTLAALAGAALLIGTTQATIQEHGKHGQHDTKKGEHDAAKKEFKGDPYLLDIDGVTGKKLGPIKQQTIIEHEGRQLRFSSAENAKMFQSNPKKYLPAIDKKMIEQQLPYYPLETCPISGMELGGMGEPLNRIYKNRLVRFCCGGCTKKFESDMTKFVAQIDAAVIAAQGKSYTAKSCPVSGEELGSMGDPIDLVAGNRLVRLCCKGCLKRFRRDPRTYFAKLESGKGVKKDGRGAFGDARGGNGR